MPFNLESAQPTADGLVRTVPTAGLQAADLGIWPIVRRAVDWHPVIQDAQAQLSSQIGYIDAAKAGYYPQISAGVNNSLQGGLYGNASVLSFSASQMLYDFGKVGAAKSYAEAGYFKQQAQSLLAVDDLATRAAQATVAVHRYQEMLRIAGEHVSGIADVVEIVRMRSSGGVSTQSELLQAVSRLDGARGNLQQVSTALDQSREHLRTLVGADAAPESVVVEDEKLRQAWAAAAEPEFNRIPRVLVALADRAAAAAQAAGARADRYPTLSLGAGTSKALSGIDPNNPGSDGWSNTVTLNLSAAIYQGGEKMARSRAANDALVAAQARIEAASLEVRASLRGLKAQVAGIERRLSTQKTRVASIEQASSLFREQYKLGTRSVLDVLNSVDEVYQARSEALNAEHDLWGSFVDYFNAGGMARDVYALTNTSIQNLDIEP